MIFAFTGICTKKGASHVTTSKNCAPSYTGFQGAELRFTTGGAMGAGMGAFGTGSCFKSCFPLDFSKYLESFFAPGNIKYLAVDQDTYKI